MNWIRKTMISALAIAGALSGNIATSANTAFANDTYVDKACHQSSTLSELDQFIVFYQENFISKEKNYWFYAARYQDGAVILCTSQPEFVQPQLLPAKTLQNQFIPKITKAPRSQSVFLITVREGNGFRVPMKEYRLDLSNLSQPKLTLLKSWLDRGRR
jgi:hypothetical protein